MSFVNDTGQIAVILEYFTLNVTGDIFLTLLSIVLFFTLISFALNLPLEFSALFILPLLLVSVAHYGNLLSTLGVFLIYLAFVLSKRFILK